VGYDQAEEGGHGCPPGLRLALDTAKTANMPADNMDRAVKKGTGELEGVNYEEVNYEGYGPGGVALLIETLTDNAKRTVADVRHILDKHDGNLGTSGSVAWQFDRKGQIFVDENRYHEEAVFEAAIQAGAEDVSQEGGEFVITTDPVSFQEVKDGMKDAGVESSQAELTFIAKNEVSVAGKDARKLLKILDDLEENDDVQKVHSNADIDEAALAEAE